MQKFRAAWNGICPVLVALELLFLMASPARAVWGDYDDPMPILFGMELGADIRKYPELAKLYDGFYPGFNDNLDGKLVYGGIPVHEILYHTYNNRIAYVLFAIKADDFPQFRQAMRVMFGNERIYTDEHNLALPPGYYWGKYEVEVHTADSIAAPGWQYIAVKYLPLANLERADITSAPRNFKYQGVTLTHKVKNYPFLYPVREESPDIAYYQSDKPPLIFKRGQRPAVKAESETWVAYKNIIYSLELRGDNSEERFLAWDLSDLYKLDFPPYDFLCSEVRVGDYTFYFPQPGLAVLTHMPTYWRMLRDKAKLDREYLEVKP